MFNMNKEVIQLHRSIIEVLWSVATLLYVEPNVLKSSLKYLFECLTISTLKEDTCEVLILVMDYCQVSIVTTELLTDVFASIFQHQTNSV